MLKCFSYMYEFLQSRSVDYQQQALFSFVFWPFSIKLLWAPLVDGAYLQRFGRRKSWLVPTQYCIAGVMFILSQRYVFSKLFAKLLCLSFLINQ